MFQHPNRIPYASYKENEKKRNCQTPSKYNQARLSFLEERMEERKIKKKLWNGI
jgi:hypothetical protein